MNEDSLIGHVFDLESCINQGGSGKIYLATDPKTGEKLAIKSIEKCGCDNAESSWRREERVLAAISSDSAADAAAAAGRDYIVQVYQAAEEARKIHFIMEYCRGGSLQDYLFSTTCFPQNASTASLSRKVSPCAPELIDGAEMQVAGITYQMLKALQHLHSCGIVHADVHLRNFGVQVVQDDDGFCNRRLKLFDFGNSGRLVNAAGDECRTASSCPLAKDYKYYARLGGHNELLAPEILRCCFASGICPRGLPEHEARIAACRGELEKCKQGEHDTQVFFRWEGRPADIWALGCCVFALLSKGKTPFHYLEQDIAELEMHCNDASEEGAAQLRSLSDAVRMENELRKFDMFARIVDDKRDRRLGSSGDPGQRHQSLASVRQLLEDVAPSQLATLFVEDFVLNPDWRLRPSADQCLSHDWMRWYVFQVFLHRMVAQPMMTTDTFCALERTDLELFLKWMAHHFGRQESESRISADIISRAHTYFQSLHRRSSSEGKVLVDEANRVLALLEASAGGIVSAKLLLDVMFEPAT
eukprot:TRINITY_DN8896_c2_g1_i1.p1 TRINITY_DN8896_c2_g1~~TRINITY_DN8896_c2_g1_i1.p1  ORF type:complete len:530 (+),score=67.70 TRINITY_DN8896_c2_g1_i1:57-1646(+)